MSSSCVYKNTKSTVEGKNLKGNYLLSVDILSLHFLCACKKRNKKLKIRQILGDPQFD